MNACWVLVVPLVAVTAGQVLAEPVEATKPSAIAAAVKQLGDADYLTRERATVLLIKAGEAARAAVEQAAKSNDPEAALRARLVLKRLASGIDPEIPPAMAALVEEFNEIDASRRFTLIHRLSLPDEFRTMWRVIRKLPDAAQRSSLESSLRSRMTSLASDYYRDGKLDEAEALLAAAAEDPRSEAALVTFLFVSGRLQKRIEGLSEAPSARLESSQARHLALLHRAAGDLAKARDAARAFKDKELSLWLAAEAGDWTEALAINRSRYSDSQPTVDQLAFTLLLSYYAGDESSLAQAKDELLRRAADRPEDSWPVAEALLAAEQLDDAIALLERSVPAAAFYLHWYRTHYDRAFALAGVAEGRPLDKAWFDALPDGNLTRTSLSIQRTYYADYIAGCLQYVGRRDDARRVRDLLAESLAGEPPTSTGWTALVSADLRLGLRDLALEDAARGFAPAKGQQPPGRSHAIQVSIANRLWGDDALPALFPVWTIVLAAAEEDPRRALHMIDPLLHPPSAARLSPDERRARLEELAVHRPESPRSSASDRYRQAERLMEIGRLAARLGEEDLAYRYRQQAMVLRGRLSERYAQQMLASAAYADQDWPAVVRLLESTPPESRSGQTWHDQLGLAKAMLGRRDEARTLLDDAVGFRVDAGTYATQGAILLKHGRKAEAAERMQIASRLMPPGDGGTINAINALGNALYEETPAAAIPLWRLNMLGPLQGTTNLPLETYVKNLCVIHRVQARDAIARGDYAQALIHGHGELDAMPGNVGVIDQLVPLLDAAGQRPLADELFERAHETYAGYCDRYPRSTRHRNLLARTAARAGRKLDEAQAAIGQALELHAVIDNPTERAELHATQAEVHLARGEPAAAIRAAELGLSMAPGHPLCTKVLAKARQAADK